MNQDQILKLLVASHNIGDATILISLGPSKKQEKQYIKIIKDNYKIIKSVYENL